MSDDTKHNEPASDATSPARPEELSEAEFLNHEAESAREAVTETIAGIRASAVRVCDVRGWARRFPWITLGAATAAGFLATTALRRSRQPKRRDEEDPALLERILIDEQIANRLRELAAEDKAPKKRDSAVQDTLGILLKTFGPAVQSAITSALAAKAAAAEAAQQVEDAPPAEDEPEKAR